MRKLDDDDRRGVWLPGEEGNREFAIVNESGLYMLILRSDSPASKKFKKWITSEVLPSIRKTGSYSVSDEDKDPIEQLEMHLRFMKRQQAEMQRQKSEISLLVNKIATVEEVAKQDDDTLTSDQISELDQLINKKYKEFGDVRNVGMIRKRLKEEFFSIKGSRTYKEIPRRGFEKAKAIINSYIAPSHLVGRYDKDGQ